MKNFFLFILMVLILSNCQNEKKPIVLLTPQVISYYKTENLVAKNYRIVYYYSGDCSLCYGNIAMMSRKLPKVPLVILSSSDDTVLIKSYMKKISYRGKVFVDSNMTFMKKNYEILKNSKILLLGSDNQVLAKVENVFDKEALASFEEQMQLN